MLFPKKHLSVGGDDPESYSQIFGFEFKSKNQTPDPVFFDDKPRDIDNTLPPILDRLEITADQWRMNTTQFKALHPKRFNRIIPQLDTG